MPAPPPPPCPPPPRLALTPRHYVASELPLPVTNTISAIAVVPILLAAIVLVVVVVVAMVLAFVMHSCVFLEDFPVVVVRPRPPTPFAVARCQHHCCWPNDTFGTCCYCFKWQLCSNTKWLQFTSANGLRISSVSHIHSCPWLISLLCMLLLYCCFLLSLQFPQLHTNPLLAIDQFSSVLPGGGVKSLCHLHFSQVNNIPGQHEIIVYIHTYTHTCLHRKVYAL